MSVRPVRFLHVGNLRLDQPVRTAILLDDRARKTLVAANGSAWEQIVLEAIDRNVDIVVIDGNSFDAQRAGSGTEQKLCGGIEQLLDAGVAVAVRPGRLDPLDAWRELQLSRVQFIPPDLSEPIELYDGHGDVRAVFLNLATSQTFYDVRDDVPRIGSHDADTNADVSLIDLPWIVDYLTISASAVWKSRGETHLHRLQLAGPQALHRSEQNPTGCLVCEVDSNGALDVKRIATSTVRLLEFQLTVDRQSTLEDVCLEMQSRHEQLAVEPHEKLRLIRWNVFGEGKLATELLGDDGEMLDLAWREEFTSHDTLQVLQEFAVDLASALQPGQMPAELHSMLTIGPIVARDRWETELESLFGSEPRAAALRDCLLGRISAAECGRQARTILPAELNQLLEERHS